jgi:hypothetical protein
MKVRWRSRELAWSILIWLACTPAYSAPPWELFKRIEADPNKSYAASEANGPWMILATTFRGPQAERQAHELVLELRKRFKLTAYTHRKTFDYTGRETGLGLTPDGRPKVMRHMQAVVEVAVLVGDFSRVDDPDVEKVLHTIRYAEPHCLASGSSTAQTFSELRRWQKQLLPAGSERKQRGPMGHAFVVTNPLLPPEFFAPKGLDKLVLDMNKQVEHSLLDCPGKYSVRVATFSGAVLIDQRKIREVQSGKPLESRLVAAAEKAHALTDLLRRKGYEAYVFHDRHASYVTVGSFNSVGTPRPDGKIEINPQIHKIMQTFGADPSSAVGGVIKPKRVGDIVLDIQPLPVEVPRRSISTDYAQSPF